ncbi:4Fe-4S dicluster domain-containing protein [candidate division TA06 bacterium]|nr:4Fe-4S dicluster domain-containing protein [candidate division TA06 bacterium]
MILSKIKEAIICFKNLRVTFPYPLKRNIEALPVEGFRGKLTIDVSKCIGCAGCANVCPSRLIIVTDKKAVRRLDFYLERCTYCGRCADVCPEKAITMTQEFETATNDVHNDMHISAEVYMGTCQRCGRCFETQTILDKMMTVGFRNNQAE